MVVVSEAEVTPGRGGNGAASILGEGEDEVAQCTVRDGLGVDRGGRRPRATWALVRSTAVARLKSNWASASCGKGKGNKLMRRLGCEEKQTRKRLLGQNKIGSRRKIRLLKFETRDLKFK
jgi:hypothetical protein